MPVRNLAILIPVLWDSGGPPPGTQLAAFCRRADELGFHSLWVPDRMMDPGTQFPHPMGVLAFAAGVTQRIGLGTAVTLTALRHPVEMADQAATLDALSGGRLTLGIGIGGREGEYEAMGVTAAHRVGRFTEGIAVMRRLWTEREVTFHGRYFRFTRATLAPRTKGDRAIPLPFGGAAAPALRRAGRLGDGWIQGGRGTAQAYRDAWRTVQDAAADAGRDVSALMSGKLMYVNPGRDPAAAMAEIRRATVPYYGQENGMAQAAGAGSAEAVADVIRAYRDAGCQLPMLGLPWPDVDKLEWLASEVAPLVD